VDLGGRANIEMVPADVDYCVCSSWNSITNDRKVDARGD
jgi:hypothetical protein